MPIQFQRSWTDLDLDQYRDTVVRIQRIYGGTSEIMKEVIARAM